MPPDSAAPATPVLGRDGLAEGLSPGGRWIYLFSYHLAQLGGHSFGGFLYMAALANIPEHMQHLEGMTFFVKDGGALFSHFGSPLGEG